MDDQLAYLIVDKDGLFSIVLYGQSSLLCSKITSCQSLTLYDFESQSE